MIVKTATHGYNRNKPELVPLSISASFTSSFCSRIKTEDTPDTVRTISLKAHFAYNFINSPIKYTFSRSFNSKDLVIYLFFFSTHEVLRNWALIERAIASLLY